jgi:glycosyltransferase involved in cell wall biosynthesis
MDLSVLIPTYQRPRVIHQCLEHLAAQETRCDYEIIVGLDGHPHITPDPKIPKLAADRIHTIRPGRVGLPQLRRAMLEHAQGRIVLWLNDDAYALPGLLQAHFDSHTDSQEPRVVEGRADFKPVQNPTLFDKVLHNTDLVFFGQPSGSQLVETTPRNCFGLNMSFPRKLAYEVGSVAEVREHYGYEDIELAWRMSQHGAACVYQPNARVVHDHRYTPPDVHRREYLLGRAAWAFAQVNPEFMHELLGADLCELTMLNELPATIRHAWRDGIRIERSFLDLEYRAPDSIDPELLAMLAEHWVLLKRLLWRWGVLDASRSISPRWSLLHETSLEEVLSGARNPV